MIRRSGSAGLVRDVDIDRARDLAHDVGDPVGLLDHVVQLLALDFLLDAAARAP